MNRSLFIAEFRVKFCGALASPHVAANTLSALKAPEHQFSWLMKAINPELFELSHDNIFVGASTVICSSHVREAVFGQISFEVKILLLFQFARKTEFPQRPSNLFCAEFLECFSVQQRFVVSLSFLPCQNFISSAINSPPASHFVPSEKLLNV